MFWGEGHREEDVELNDNEVMDESGDDTDKAEADTVIPEDFVWGIESSSSEICSSSSILCLSLNSKRCSCICHHQDNNIEQDIHIDIQIGS